MKTLEKTQGKLFLILGIFLLLGQFVSCKSRSPTDFSYRRQSFAVRGEGNLGGAPLLCDIYCENGVWRTVEYHAPDPLAGILVSVDENGEYRVSKDGIEAVVDEESPVLQGLVRPARILLLDGGDPPDPRSVQRLSEGDRFTVSAEGEDAPVTLTLDDAGFPIFASGGDFSFRVSILRLSESGAD